MSRDEQLGHVHCHSDYSQLDGACKVKDYVQEVEQRGNPAFALTEHGSMRSFYELHQQTKDTAVKPIYGIEFYFVEDMRRRGLTEEEKKQTAGHLEKRKAKAAIKQREKDLGLRESYHLTAWAKNDTGLHNLFKLSSLAFTDGFYYRPRIDFDALAEHRDGIAIGTACVAGIATKLVTQDKPERATEIMDVLYDLFGADLWLEIMPHVLEVQGVEIQGVANQWMVYYAERYEYARLLATQDAHYLTEDDAGVHDMLLAIGTNKVASDPNRFRFRGGPQYFLKTREQMRNSFLEAHYDALSEQQIEEALDNTLVLAEQCNAKLDMDRFKALLPEIQLPDGYDDEFAYIRELCERGWAEREISDRAKRLAEREGVGPLEVHQRYIKRLSYELKMIQNKKFVRYFLMVRELYDWTNAKDIPHGPGRGSAAGSLVSFLLGLTEVDPLEHGLLFERFISEGRIDLPDLDCDFGDERRQEILDHLEEKYGADKVCRISVFGTLASRQAVRDVGRVLEIPYHEIDEVAKALDKEKSLVENFENVLECKDFNDHHPDVLAYGQHLEGMIKSLGIHASGVVISSVPIMDIVPVETRLSKQDGQRVRVSSVDMYGVQDMGLVKLDVLGLRTITVLQRAVDSIRERHGVEIDSWHLALDDPDTLAGFTEQDFDGVFQFDTQAMARVTSGVVFEGFADVAAMNALNRPGPARSGLTAKYLKRKKGQAKVDWDAMHPVVADITRDTYGVLVYQEQVMRLLSELGWFDPAATDEVRKKIGKSKGKAEIEPIRAKFVLGAGEKGMEPDEAHALMDAVVEFGGYAFTMSHAVAYSMIAYACMWIKRRYPLEFFWALLVSEPKDDRIRRMIRGAKRRNIEILPPHVSTSGAGFILDAAGDGIRGSLVDIKYVGEAAANEITEHQPYADAVDFFSRTKRKAVNKRAVHSLLVAGALDGLVPSIKGVVEGFDELWELVKKGKHERLEILLATMASGEEYGEEERLALAVEVNPSTFGVDPLDQYRETFEAHFPGGLGDLDATGFYSHDRACLVLAQVKNVAKYYGDRDEEEHEKDWSKVSASAFVLDAAGGEHRVRIDQAAYKRFEEIADSLCTDEPLLALVSVDSNRRSLRAECLYDADEFKARLENGSSDLNLWERLAVGKHPSMEYPWKKKATRRRVLLDFGEVVDGTKVDAYCDLTGVVTSVFEIRDKKNREMAFVSLLGHSGFVAMTVFGSAWPEYRKHVQAGTFLTARALKTDRGLMLDQRQGRVWLHESES